MSLRNSLGVPASATLAAAVLAAAAAAAAVTTPAAASARCAASGSAVAVGFGHLHARRQPELAFGHHVFARGQPLGDDHFLALLPRDRHLPHFRGAIRLDDVDVLAGRRRLYRARRYDDRVLVAREIERDLDEEPRPQALVGVLE